MPHVRNITGPPVTGNDFYNRVHEQRLLWRKLNTQHVLLLAPRRVGKTSLMLKLRETAEAQNFKAIYLSVADVTTEEEFVRRLYEAVDKINDLPRLVKNLKDSKLVDFFKRINLHKVGVTGFGQVELTMDPKDDWSHMVRALLQALTESKERWLLIVDELPIFILNMLQQDVARAERFLHAFRSMREEPDLQDHLRWLLAGSIGLDTVTSLHNLSGTIGDLYLSDLGPFSENDAYGLLDLLGKSQSFPLSEDVIRYILQQLQWLIPFFLQLLFSELQDHCERTNQAPSVACVDEVMDALLRPEKQSYFDYWRQRLFKELGQVRAEHATFLLNAIAQQDAGISKESLQRTLRMTSSYNRVDAQEVTFLLSVLEREGYTVSTTQNSQPHYTFRSALLRAYWSRTHHG